MSGSWILGSGRAASGIWRHGKASFASVAEPAAPGAHFRGGRGPAAPAGDRLAPAAARGMAGGAARLDRWARLVGSGAIRADLHSRRGRFGPSRVAVDPCRL